MGNSKNAQQPKETVISPSNDEHDVLEQNENLDTDQYLPELIAQNSGALLSIDRNIMEDFFNMVSNNSYFQNMFQGNLQPVKRKRRATPAIERTHKFDSNREGNYNLVKVFVHYPTLEYPEKGIFIQFTKGNQSTFMRILSLEVLDNISQFLTQTKTEIEALLPELDKMELTAKQQQNEYFAKQSINQEMVKKLMEQLQGGDIE